MMRVDVITDSWAGWESEIGAGNFAEMENAGGRKE